MKEAKVKQKEFGIKGKNCNNLNNNGNTIEIIKEVRNKIKEELSFLNEHFNYDLNQFYNDNLIYSLCFLVFFNYNELRNINPLEPVVINNFFIKNKKNLLKFNTPKIINLITAFELLGIGLSTHEFSENYFDLNLDNNSETKYTIELLFGDVFYSRAVLYFIKYENFLVFKEVLNSLFKVHDTRIMLHQKISKYYNDLLKNDKEKDETILEIVDEKIINLNALLKSCFLISLGESNFDFSLNNNIYLRLIENIVMLKTLNDILNKLQKARQQAQQMINIIKLKNDSINTDVLNDFSFYNFIKNKKESTILKINKDIELIKTPWLKDNFKNLVKLF